MAWPGARSLWRIVHPPRARCARLCSSLLVAVPPASLRGHCPATGARHGAAKLGDIPRGISKHVGGCWWAPFCPRTMPGVVSSVVPAGRPQHGMVEAPSRWEAPSGRSRSRSTGGAPSEHLLPAVPEQRVRLVCLSWLLFWSSRDAAERFGAEEVALLIQSEREELRAEKHPRGFQPTDYWVHAPA